MRKSRPQRRQASDASATYRWLYVPVYVVVAVIIANQVGAAAAHYDPSLGKPWFDHVYYPTAWLGWWFVPRTDTTAWALAGECTAFIVSAIVLLIIQESDFEQSGISWGWWQPVVTYFNVIGEFLRGLRQW